MKRLAGKIAVVTGGSSGIGRGIVKQFYKEGAQVIIFGRDQKKLDSVREEISPDIATICGDVTKTDDLKALFKTVSTQFGKINILVANAGVGNRLALREATEEAFDYMVNINYRGLFFTVRHSLNFLDTKAASIILLSSITANMMVKNHSIYSSSKAAVSKLAETMAIDLADENIRVNAILPGFINTPIFKERLAKNPNLLTDVARKIPLKRIGQPIDIAHAATFLASDDASYITGAKLVVDGGLSGFLDV